MSTLSGSLNSSAAAAVNDFYLPACREKPSPEHLLRVSRALTGVFGLVQIGVAFAGQLLARSVVENVMAIALFTSGVVLGVFFLGVLAPRVTQRGALVGLVGGLAVMTTLVVVIPFATKMTLLAWPWYAIVGSAVTFAVGLVTAATQSPRLAQRRVVS
jgi:SSS family solute:Na+ symporter